MTRTFGDISRTPRRQRLVRHLIECGERPVLEAMLAVENGQDLDQVLEGFGRLPAEFFWVMGADTLPIDKLALIEGGRR